MSSTSPSTRRTPSIGLGRIGSRAEAALDRARLHVVPRVPQLGSRAPRMPFVTLVSVLLLGGVVGLLLFNTSMQQASFQATALQQQADTLDAQQQALQSDIDRLDDPQQIAARATRMGMVVPPTSDYLHLDSGRIVGHAAPASAQDRLSIKPPPVLTRPVRTVPGTAPVPTDPVHTAPGAQGATGTTTGTTSGAKSAHRTGAATTHHGANPDSGRQTQQNQQQHRHHPHR